jgi:hypothetical protein
MLNKNNLSVIRKHNYDYCLAFSGNGYISIDPLTSFLDHRNDFYFEMSFKINSFPSSGYKFLMNSCLSKTDNKLGIAIDRTKLYVQVDKGSGGKTELWVSFTDNTRWHSISVTNNRGSLSSLLDQTFLQTNPSASLSLPSTLGFRIASDTSNAQNLNGLFNNILITNLSVPLAKYVLNEGSGTIVYDSVGSNNGSISNASWLLY